MPLLTVGKQMCQSLRESVSGERVVYTRKSLIGVSEVSFVKHPPSVNHKWSLMFVSIAKILSPHLSETQTESLECLRQFFCGVMGVTFVHNQL